MSRRNLSRLRESWDSPVFDRTFLEHQGHMSEARLLHNPGRNKKFRKIRTKPRLHRLISIPVRQRAHSPLSPKNAPAYIHPKRALSPLRSTELISRRLLSFLLKPSKGEDHQTRERRERAKNANEEAVGTLVQRDARVADVANPRTLQMPCLRTHLSRAVDGS
jgi:hypothetical protein